MWEIFAYQNSDSLFGIFNAIAAIRGSDTYLSAMGGVAFCGFIAALLAYAFAPHKLQGWQWLASVVLVYSVLFVPRVAVGIVDKTGGAPVKVVANVPFGLAVLGSMTSTIGNTLTALFETAFQAIPGAAGLPAELTYQKNGLLFGNRLIRETGQVVFPDPAFRTDMINFIHNCTLYDIIDGTIDAAVFAKADDAWAMMATPNPARFSTVSRGASVDALPCPAVYADLNSRLPAQVNSITGKLAVQLNPTLPGAVAAGVIASQIEQAYLKNRIANAAKTAGDLIRQNAILNAISDTGQLVSQKQNDPAAMMLAVGRAQAVAQTNAAWRNNGKIAEQALPVVRNVIEALAYALFPIVVLLLMLTGGRETMLALKNYCALLIWIQLWPPLYAILNYMATMFAASELAAAANVGGGATALSLMTSSPIYANAISAEAVVGYLTLSIPFIAWAALKRMENFGSAVTGGLSGLQSAVAASTGAAASGNVSMGNVAMDQMQLAPNRTSAFMQSWQSDVTGNTMTSNIVNGRTGVSLLRNQGFASRVVSVRVSEQEVSEANKQAEAARSDAVSANRERSAVLADTLSKGIATVRSSRTSSGTSSSNFEQTAQTLNRLDQISKSVSEKTGLSQAQVAQIAFGVAGQAGLSTPVGGIGVNAKAGKTSTASLTADEQKVVTAMSSDQIAAFKQFGERVAHDSSVLQVVATDARDAHELSTRLATTTAKTERADAAFAERTAFAQRLSSAREHGETLSIDIAQDPHNVDMFTRYAEQYGGNSAAALTLLDAELARQGPRPQRFLSTGAALPSSFEEIRRQHDGAAANPRLQPDFSAIENAHNARVSKVATQVRATDTTATPPALHDDITSRGMAIRSQVETARAAFDTRGAVVTAPDGKLTSTKSLLKQAGGNVLEDARNTAGEAKTVIEELLDKK